MASLYKTSPFESVEVCDGDALEEGDHEEGHAPRKVVEEGEDVVAGPVRERQREHEAQAADQACKETEWRQEYLQLSGKA